MAVAAVVFPDAASSNASSSGRLEFGSIGSVYVGYGHDFSSRDSHEVLGVVKTAELLVRSFAISILTKIWIYPEKFSGYYLPVTSKVTKFTSNLLVNLVTSNKFRLLVTLLVTVTSKLLVTSIWQNQVTGYYA